MVRPGKTLAVYVQYLRGMCYFFFLSFLKAYTNDLVSHLPKIGGTCETVLRQQVLGSSLKGPGSVVMFSSEYLVTFYRSGLSSTVLLVESLGPPG